MKQANMKKVLNKYSMYFVLLALVLIMSVFSRDFLRFGNLMNVLVSEAGRGILALGVAFVIISGGIDLSVGAVVALSAVIGASFLQQPTYASRLFPNLPDLPIFVGIAAALLTGVLVGLFNGSLVAYRKVPPFIATLGGQVIARGIAYTYTNAYPVSMLKDKFKIIAQGNIRGIPYFGIYFVIVAIIAFVLLNKTRFGKSLYAIGGNPNTARVAGINVERELVRAYIWSGVMASIAGIALAARAGSAIASLGDGYELDAIAAATIGGVSQSGGVGTVGGVVVGVFILGILNNGFLLLGVSPYLQQIIKGFIIVGAVMFDMRKVARRK